MASIWYLVVLVWVQSHADACIEHMQDDVNVGLSELQLPSLRELRLPEINISPLGLEALCTLTCLTHLTAKSVRGASHVLPARPVRITPPLPSGTLPPPPPLPHALLPGLCSLELVAARPHDVGALLLRCPGVSRVGRLGLVVSHTVRAPSVLYHW